MPDSWLIPDWPAPPGVHAVFTTRGTGPGNGASAGGWGFFNLGDHVGDEPAAVASNRRHLQQVLGAQPVFLNQVHGNKVLQVAAATPHGLNADAAVTRESGVACTIMVADCLPLLLADRDGRCVAAVHVGWRGLVAGVIERAVRAVLDTDKWLRAESLLAWLGPCIGPEAFEVGGEVYAAAVEADTGAAACFRPTDGGKYLADLPAWVHRKLKTMNIPDIHGNDGSACWCTVGNPRHYFSYRRDQQRLGHSGRMAACIWLLSPPS